MQEAPLKILKTIKENKTVAGGLFFAFSTVLILLLIAGRSEVSGFFALVTAMVALSGLIIYDILGRRAWERRVDEEIHGLSGSHDRLVREVARNRNDLALLKDGIAEAAYTAVEHSGERESSSVIPMAEKLSRLGNRPRAALTATPAANDILALELAPPPDNRPPPASVLENVLSADLEKYTSGAVREILHHAVRHDEIDLFLQPVVNLPQRRPCMYELYARVRAGEGVRLPAARYEMLAAQDQLQPAIDALLLARCLTGSSRSSSSGRHRTSQDVAPILPCMLNVTGATLRDRGFMGALIAFLGRHPETAQSLILELPQAELEGLDDSAAQVLEGLARLGCRVSMDRVRKAALNVDLLKERRVRFLKLDSAWLAAEAAETNGFSRLMRLKRRLDAAGIDLIAEKIESEDVLRELLDLNIAFGQGYLFGKPDNAVAFGEGAGRVAV